jgi:two-component system response regulator DesR
MQMVSFGVTGARSGVRVLIGYHGGLVRAALADALSRQPGLTVVAAVARTDDVPAVAALQRADVVVLDVMLPGTLAVTGLCATFTDCPLLVVLDQRSGALFGRTLAGLAPRVGLVAADATVVELAAGIRRLAAGETVLEPGLALTALRSAQPTLTERERDVLRLAANGMTANDIARKINLSSGTVRNYLARILAKLGARSRIEAIRIAQDAGWI